jgi:bifunctional DNA-binding transcriptional regulator/antitoxin component of YhaV-PrlF toxin-antitoxin module
MERKLREINGSLVVTIPKQICDIYNMKNGDMLSIESIGYGELRLKKIS